MAGRGKHVSQTATANQSKGQKKKKKEKKEKKYQEIRKNKRKKMERQNKETRGMDGYMMGKGEVAGVSFTRK